MRILRILRAGFYGVVRLVRAVQRAIRRLRFVEAARRNIRSKQMVIIGSPQRRLFVLRRLKRGSHKPGRARSPRGGELLLKLAAVEWNAGLGTPSVHMILFSEASATVEVQADRSRTTYGPFPFDVSQETLAQELLSPAGIPVPDQWDGPGWVPEVAEQPRLLWAWLLDDLGRFDDALYEGPGPHRLWYELVARAPHDHAVISLSGSSGRASRPNGRWIFILPLDRDLGLPDSCRGLLYDLAQWIGDAGAEVTPGTWVRHINPLRDTGDDLLQGWVEPWLHHVGIIRA